MTNILVTFFCFGSKRVVKNRKRTATYKSLLRKKPFWVSGIIYFEGKLDKSRILYILAGVNSIMRNKLLIVDILYTVNLLPQYLVKNVFSYIKVNLRKKRGDRDELL